MDGDNQDYKFRPERCPNLGRPAPPDPGKKIMVRMPAALHNDIFNCAHDNRTSMNALCVGMLSDAVAQAKTDRERALAAPGRD